MITFYYTATGNSLALAKEIGGELIAIPQLADFDQLAYKADAIGIVFPIYSPSAPPVDDRFSQCRRNRGSQSSDRPRGGGVFFGGRALQLMRDLCKSLSRRKCHSERKGLFRCTL